MARPRGETGRFVTTLALYALFRGEALVRITHLYKRYLPDRGGVQSAMHELARACARGGHDVRAIVCAPGLRPAREVMDGVEVLRLPSLGELWSMPLAPSFVAVPSREGEILHVHESFPLATIAALLGYARSSRARPIVTWHFDVVRQRALVPIHQVLARRLLARAAAIHVTTDLLATRSRILAPFTDKVRVIPHMVDVDRFAQRPTHPLAMRMRSWAAEAPVALFVGRLVYYKGIEVLLDALMALPHLRLAVVGAGPRRASLQRHAEAIGAGGRVLWLGELSDDDLVGAYSGADVFVLPSVAPTETFGVVQVEAMAAGLPVISTRLGTGVESVNVDGRTGIVVPPGDAVAIGSAIEEIIAEPRARSRMGAAAFERARDFAPARLIGAYLELYASAEG